MYVCVDAYMCIYVHNTPHQACATSTLVLHYSEMSWCNLLLYAVCIHNVLYTQISRGPFGCELLNCMKQPRARYSESFPSFSVLCPFFSVLDLVT